MTELNFHNRPPEDPRNFEVTLQIKDKHGNPTGKTKTFSSAKSGEISNWYNKQQPHKKRSNKKRKKQKPE